MLPPCQHPGIFIGDFNSHSTEWGYNEEDENGEKLVNWANLNHTYLIYDAKQGGTFNSGRWGTTTSPDLCFVTKNELDQPFQVRRTILNKFPKSQHCPIVVEVGINLPRFNKPELPRWNIRKANWDSFSKYIEDNINRIEPVQGNYTRFIKLLKTAATKSIPRGHVQNYIPCWNKKCEEVLREYEENGSDVSANRLMNLLDEERRKRWINAVENLDFSNQAEKAGHSLGS